MRRDVRTVTRYDVYAGDDDPDIGGNYELVGSFEGKQALLAAIGCAMVRLCESKGVQIVPVDIA